MATFEEIKSQRPDLPDDIIRAGIMAYEEEQDIDPAITNADYSKQASLGKLVSGAKDVDSDNGVIDFLALANATDEPKQRSVKSNGPIDFLALANFDPLDDDVAKLRELNSGASNETLKAYAKFQADKTLPTQITKQEDLKSRTERYQSAGSDVASAAMNAQFDQSLQDKLSKRRANEGRNYISNRIDPLADKAKTKRDNADLAQARDDVLQQQWVEENPNTSALLSGLAGTSGGLWGAVRAANDLVGNKDSTAKEVATWLQDQSRRYQTEISKQEFLDAEDKGEWLLNSFIQNAPSMVMSGIGMVSPMAAPYMLGVMATTSGGGQYNTLVNNGVDRRIAGLAGVAYGAVEAASEALPMKFGQAALGRLKQMTLGQQASLGKRIIDGVQFAGGAMAVEGFEEVVAGAGHGAIDIATGRGHESLSGNSTPFTRELGRMPTVGDALNKGVSNFMGGVAGGAAHGMAIPVIANAQRIQQERAVEAYLTDGQFNPEATARDAMLAQVNEIDPRVTARVAQAAIATAPTVADAVDAFNVATAAPVNQDDLLSAVTRQFNEESPLVTEPIPLATQTTQANDAQVVAEQATAPAGEVSAPVVRDDSSSTADLREVAEGVATDKLSLTVPAQPTTTQPIEQKPTALTIPPEIAARTVTKTNAELSLMAKTNTDPVVQEAVKQEQEKRTVAVNAGNEQKSDSSLNRDSSWVIRNKETGEVIMETVDKKKVDALNTAKYEAVPIQEYLGSINGSKPVEPAPKSTTQQSIVKQDLSGLAARDDLVGAIMRVTGNQGIAANMAQTITGDKAGSGNPKLRGLFLNGGTMDLGDVAELLRVQENYDVRDGDHLSELIREQAAGNPVYSTDRMEREAAANAEKQYKSEVNRRAEELGLKKVGGRRTLQMVEADIARVEQERSEMEAKAERAAIQAESVYTEIYDQDMSEADWMAWMSSKFEYTQEEIDYVKAVQANREDARTEEDAGDDTQEQARGDTGQRQENGAVETREGGTREEGFDLTGETNAEAAANAARKVDPNALTKEEINAQSAGFGLQQQDGAPKPGPVQDGLVFEESAVYTVNEPDDISGDLFQGTENALPETKRKNIQRTRKASGGAATASPGQTTTVLAIRQSKDVEGAYNVITQLVTVGERALPVDRVNSWQDAVLAFSGLSKYAVEHFDALVTDANGTPLAVIGGFKGATTMASVFPSTVMMELARIEGAAHVWAGHNHPSGRPDLSRADESLSSAFENILRGSSVEYHGLSAVARTGDTVAWSSTTNDNGSISANRKNIFTVPIVEREIVESNPGATVSSPATAKSIVVGVAKERPGIVFLTAQNAVSAFVPFDPNEMGELRKGDRLMRLFSAASKSGGVAAIVAMPDGFVTNKEYANIKGALGTIDVKVLDGIEYESDGSGAVKSLAERSIDTSNGANFYSKGASQGTPLTEAEATTEVIKKFGNAGKVLIDAGQIVMVRTEEGLRNLPGAVAWSQKQSNNDGMADKDTVAGTQAPTSAGDGSMGSATIEVDGVLRSTLNSNGKPIHPTAEGIINFWRWFGDSKVVDDEGRPVVVYHGSDNDIRSFDPAMLGKNTNAASAKKGFFFAGHPRTTYAYMENGVNGNEAIFSVAYGWTSNIYREKVKQWQQEEDQPTWNKDVPFEWLVSNSDRASLRKSYKARISELKKKSSGMMRRVPLNSDEETEKRQIEEWLDEDAALILMAQNSSVNKDFSEMSEDEVDIYIEDHLGWKKAGANIMPVYIKIDSPAEFDDVDQGYREQSYSERIDIATKSKNDGLIILNTADGFKSTDTIYVVFDPKSIKSASGNAGFFGSNTNPNEPSASAGSDAKLAKEQGAIQGATLPDGRIVLVLENLTKDNIESVLKHEAIHSMLKNLVGEKTYNQLMRQLESNLKFAKGNEWVKQAHQRAVDAGTKEADVTEEIAAYATEEVTNGAKVPSFIKRWVDSFLSAIRTALIRGAAGEKAKLWAMKNLKPEDLARLAVAGLRAKAAQIERVQAGREAMAYSKSASGNNGDFDGANPDIRYSRAPAQQPQPAPLPEETKARKAQRLGQDKFNRFTVIKDWLAEQGIALSEQADVYKAEERMHSRFANQVEDFRNKLVEPLIKKIQAAGFSMDDVSMFLHAQHAEERNNQIAKINPTVADGSGMSTADANNVLAAAPAELKALANEFRQITEMTKQTLLTSGIISQDMVDAWEGAYSNYIPLKGGPDGAKAGTGKGLHVNGKMKRALGHGKREGGEWIVENILADYERAVMLAEKNRVGQHLIKMALEVGRDDVIALNKPEKRAVLRNSHAYEVRYNGSLVAVFDSETAAKTFKTTLGKAGVTITKTNDPSVIYSASPMLQDNEANVYVNGHAIRVQINDDLLAQAYKNLGAEPLNAILSAGRMLNGYLSKAYTGYNPEFILTNIVRDFTTGLINITGEEGAMFAAKSAKNYLSSFGQMLKYAVTGNETQWIKDYRADGGNTGAAYLSDLERLGKEIKTEYASYKGVLENLKEKDGAGAARAAGRNLFNWTLKWIEHLNQAGENAMRLSIYRTAIESGKTRAEAASLAKNSTVNFNRKGELGAQANALYLFFNAGVQGTSALAHAHFKGKHKYQAWALSSGMIALGYLMASAFGGGDEDDYDRELSDYDKSRNLVIRAGDSWVKIPVPYGYGFFYNLGRHFADSDRKGEWDKMPWHLASDFVGEFTPFSGVVAGKEPDARQGIYALPTAFQIPGAVAVNRTGMGSPIFPDSAFDPNRPDNLKMWRNTKGSLSDDMAQALAKAGLEVSPETLKYLGRTATGGSGAFVGAVADAGKLTAEGADMETKEMPFVRKFVKEGSVSDYRAAYYEAKSEASKAADDLSRAKKMGDMMSAKKLMEDNGELIAMDKYADKLSKTIKAKRDMQDVIKQNDNLTIAEKRMRLKAMEIEEQKLYDKYLDIYKQKTQQRKDRLDKAA